MNVRDGFVDAELEALRREYDETQEVIAMLAEALGFDWKMAWDHDSCPNNSECLTQLVTVAETNKRELVGSLREARKHLNANFLYALPNRVMPMGQVMAAVKTAAAEIAEAEHVLDTLIDGQEAQPHTAP